MRMFQERRRALPAIPTTVDESVLFLRGDGARFADFRNIDGKMENIFRSHLVAPGGGQSLVLNSSEMLTVLRNSASFVADAAFDPVPRRPAFRQIFTIHGKHVMGNVSNDHQ